MMKGKTFLNKLSHCLLLKYKAYKKQLRTLIYQKNLKRFYLGNLKIFRIIKMIIRKIEEIIRNLKLIKPKIRKKEMTILITVEKIVLHFL